MKTIIQKLVQQYWETGADGQWDEDFFPNQDDDIRAYVNILLSADYDTSLELEGLDIR